MRGAVPSEKGGADFRKSRRERLLSRRDASFRDKPKYPGDVCWLSRAVRANGEFRYATYLNGVMS
jgi:hypothetical protein